MWPCSSVCGRRGSCGQKGRAWQATNQVNAVLLVWRHTSCGSRGCSEATADKCRHKLRACDKTWFSQLLHCYFICKYLALKVPLFSQFTNIIIYKNILLSAESGPANTALWNHFLTVAEPGEGKMGICPPQSKNVWARLWFLPLPKFLAKKENLFYHTIMLPWRLAFAGGS